ncbi:MAG TPA: hypothetical protein VFG81_10680 [Anaerolineales bacterium]|jgi:hypothetical protein|nr:hypothetical protein [Anaerolineales bacterium]
MNSSPFRREGWLYWLAFLIALGFRLLQLGASPLTDSEATLALQALQIAQGKAPLLSPQPGYILFTSILFALINTSNFMARFLPALTGSALVFAPYLFRGKIKPRPALILAFLIAIDPGLVALSRQAGGTMLAVAFLLFAWGMWRSQRLTLAGFFAGMALLCGPSLWAGLLVLGLTWLFIQGMGSKPASSEATDQSLISNPPVANYQLPISFYRPAVTSLLLTLLFGGTLFFLSPNGLSAWLSALPEYLRGWTAPSPMSAGRVLLAFFAYEPLGIFLAILSLIRGYRTKSPRILRVSLWLGVALLLAVFYRQTSELVWVILPLLILAAWELSRAFQLFAEERVEVGVVVLALMILLVYFWFGVSKIALDPITSLATNSFPLLGRNIQIPGAPYMVLVGVILVIVLCISFIAFGWSARTAWLGMTWAFVIFLGVYSLGTAWGASGLRAPTGVELWKVDQAPVQPNLLLASVNDVSEFSLGHDQSQPVTIVGIDSPALEWVLRDRTLEMVSTLDPQVAPPIVITTAMSDLGLPSAYRGQDFLWRPTPRWQEIQNPDWIRWLVFRQLPREEETIILWVRDDLFPDARETSQQP